MCTSPITITREYPLVGFKSVSVPCGGCAECKSKYRSGIAALAVHQGLVSGSVYFFTLTYDDTNCPVAISDPSGVVYDEDGYMVSKPCIVGFMRGCDAWNATPDEPNKHYLNNVLSLDGSEYLYACSLRREDIKNWFKVFRKKYKSMYHKDAKFKYIFFGELGERHGRPHYHGLVYGLSYKDACLLRDCWIRGSALMMPDTYRQMSFEEISKVSNYVTKYASKGVCSRFADLVPFIEAPRRQSSIDFGEFSKEEIARLRSMMRAMLNHLDALKLALKDGRKLLLPEIRTRFLNL